MNENWVQKRGALQTLLHTSPDSEVDIVKRKKGQRPQKDTHSKEEKNKSFISENGDRKEKSGESSFFFIIFLLHLHLIPITIPYCWHLFLQFFYPRHFLLLIKIIFSAKRTASATATQEKIKKRKQQKGKSKWPAKWWRRFLQSGKTEGHHQTEEMKKDEDEDKDNNKILLFL